MGRDPFEGKERPIGCPYDEICQTCPQATEDDACFPHERHLYEARLKKQVADAQTKGSDKP